ncbi:hypothetical protein Barb6_01349 [Bacteroidales bacterium Barb6]|nr:hypothetical protein Barb6_01349 [Bacteroidales bacterium Barb6]
MLPAPRRVNTNNTIIQVRRFNELGNGCYLIGFFTCAYLSQTDAAGMAKCANHMEYTFSSVLCSANCFSVC